MLSYPPHSAHQQQATAPMSLAFPRQTQNHHQPLQQQQQSRDEESTDKIPAVGDEELQKPLKSTEADIQCHLTPSIITSKDRAPSAAADLSDSNMSDYDYSYDDDDDEKADQTDAMMPEALVVRPRRVEDSNATQAPSAVVDGGVELKRCDRDNNDDDDDSASLADDGQRPAKSRRLDASAPTSSMWVRPVAAASDTAEKDGGDATADDHSDDSPASPFQTEIKTQRPLGLLAQHRLQTSATTSYRAADGTGRERASTGRGVDTTDTEEQRLREMFGRRLTQAELEAAVAMQERMSGGYCSVPTAAASSAVCSSLMTSLPPTPSSAGVGLDFSTASRYDSLMDRRFIPSPPLSSASPYSAHDDPASPIDATSSTSGHRHWTFQEQFKQLYEMSDDVKRKEFLDELFTFMQKRGTPVNRIPIMAKQTLDLYELFRLVVSKGGLVEVINKKLWREITKGLNLPSSITSAAFTLRTQYMKYLYPFECEKLKLSTLAELQYAVDGNRREGRRPSYGGGPGAVPGDFSPLPPPPSMPTTAAPPHLLHQPSMMPGLAATTPQHLADGLNAAALAAAAVAARTNGLGLVPRDGDAMALGHRNHQSTVNQLRTLAECDARAMESAARAMQEVMVKRIEEASSRVAAAAAAVASSQAATKSTTATSAPVKAEDLATSSKRSRSTAGEDQVPSSNSSNFVQPQSAPAPSQPPPPAHLFLPGRNAGVGAAHIKLTSRNDGRAEFDTSIVASMEVNGIVYQGVLFAQPPNIVGARI